MGSPRLKNLRFDRWVSKIANPFILGIMVCPHILE